jgi:hypothetical protein
VPFDEQFQPPKGIPQYLVDSSYLVCYENGKVNEGVFLLPTKRNRIRRELHTRRINLPEFHDLSRYYDFLTKEFHHEGYESSLVFELNFLEASQIYNDLPLVQKMGRKTIGINNEHAQTYNESLVFFTKDTEILGGYLDKGLSCFGVLILKWAQLSGESLRRVPINGYPWFESGLNLKKENAALSSSSTNLHIHRASSEDNLTSSVRTASKANANERMIIETSPGNHSKNDDSPSFMDVKDLRPDPEEERLSMQIQTQKLMNDIKRDQKKKNEKDLNEKIANLENKIKQEKIKQQAIIREIREYEASLNYVDDEEKELQRKIRNIDEELVNRWKEEMLWHFNQSFQKFKSDLKEEKDIKINNKGKLETKLSEIEEEENKYFLEENELEKQIEQLVAERDQLNKTYSKIKGELAYKRTHQGRDEPQENKTKSEPYLCYVCNLQQVNCIYLPCRHIVACYECAKFHMELLRKDCLFCLRNFSDLKQIFWN